MAALDYLRRAGLAVELEGNRLRVTPADLITADLRQFVRDHRAELLAELSAANDAQAQRVRRELVAMQTKVASGRCCGKWRCCSGSISSGNGICFRCALLLSARLFFRS
ncbi:TubC N-terminal docking domain-related protein [Pseudomonas fluvialis]|uniref:TubC N-terminal docking domain-related protein n=1 Tax=Pseudomonas fluvialis TaxID=1793966 RepID=UPI0035AD96F7